MSCTHPRQALANSKTTAMKCAWPDCEDGWKSNYPMTVALFDPLSAFGFSFEDITNYPPESPPITKVQYERVELFDIHRGETWYEWRIKVV